MSRWTAAEDDILTARWRGATREEIAALLPGRSIERIDIRANKLGLRTMHTGTESLRQAVRRSGWSEIPVREALRTAGLLPSQARRSTRRLDPTAVDRAIEAWMCLRNPPGTETIREAARRHSLHENTMAKWLVRAGTIRSGTCRHYALDPRAVDRAMIARAEVLAGFAADDDTSRRSVDSRCGRAQ